MDNMLMACARTRPLPRVGWQLFCSARAMLALSAITLGPESAVGHLAAQTAVCLSRVTAADATPL